jgi:cellulose synthase/poly-beta-1,6-N-acetylglucosamine synthase-like glycosyltransferase
VSQFASESLQLTGDSALSIVVIGRNEGQRLTRCLESVNLIRGIQGKLDAIYVDSASNDGSPQAARNLGAQVIVLHEGKRTAARGRNAGWQRALNPYVLFLDGDTIVHPHFPQVALEILEADPGVAAVWGHRRELHPDNSIYNRVLDLDWIYPPGVSDFCGGDVLMRRTALAEVGGYDPDLIAGEEPELCRRLRARGYRILHIDSPMTGHDLNIRSLGQYWRRAIRAGYAYAEISKRFRGSADPSWSQESRKNVFSAILCMAWIVAGLLTLMLPGPWTLAWIVPPLLLTARTAWRARWKAPEKWGLLWLYAIHSHLQHIPILRGQLGYSWDRRSGKQRSAIEYKEKAGA